jgi:hypothetical protein
MYFWSTARFEQVTSATRPSTTSRTEHQERGLERVLGVLCVGESAPAHPPHRRPVPAHEFGERRLVAGGAEAVQQRPVGFVAERGELVNDAVQNPVHTQSLSGPGPARARKGR